MWFINVTFNQELISYWGKKYFFIVGVSNEGEECYEKCRNNQGPCEWCGSKGVCCTQKIGWNDTSKGCDGEIGGTTVHECVEKPGISCTPNLETIIDVMNTMFY